ncbi:MAG: hypothetical protein MJ233_01560 [Mycoplasmoidaceae bacterium]|nr:hypothetical protein [Mycoplasmoidaceae bacterium]
MKKFKLFAPILALSATAATVIPMVGCTTNPSNVFDVTISDEVHEHVTLEKTKAEKGKRFETKVTLDTPFYMNKVTVMVGDKQLVEGDIDASDNFQFFYDYINNKLTIKEDVIDANVVLNFEFTYVFSDTVSYVPGHIPYLVSNHDINIQDTSKIYTFYLYMDFTG